MRQARNRRHLLSARTRQYLLAGRACRARAPAGRRQELDTRSRDIEMRESLLRPPRSGWKPRSSSSRAWRRASTSRWARATRPSGPLQEHRFHVRKHEGKDAARIFDRLDLKILVDVATQINPRKMSEILALMSPESAERLTVELAGRAGRASSPSNRRMPTIAEDRRQAELNLAPA